mgnify:CR=1 FL=1
MELHPKVIEEIEKILKNGNTVELKKEKGYIVIVEIQRKAKHKSIM